MRATLAVVILGVLAPFTGSAQATLRGHVVRSADHRPIAGVEVSVIAGGAHALTDSAGEFRLDSLPEGRQIVQVRKVGFTVVRDTVTLSATDVTTRNFAMVAQATLDTVRTVADRGQYISPGLQGFEERRTNAASGYFIPEAELRKSDEKALASIITSRMAGLSSKTTATGTALLSSRKTCAGPTFGTKGKLCTPCYVTVFVDGVMTYSASNDGTGEPYDFNRVAVDQLAGVEFYPSSGTGPAQFNATGSGCGTLLLWSRER